MTISFSLKEKIAVITGASRGIGEAIAETLAAHDAHCILVSRKEEALKQVAEKIRNNPPKLILPLRRKKFQRNKYRALYENADAGYQNAMQLIKGLDVEKIKQAITDNEIGYIKL